MFMWVRGQTFWLPRGRDGRHFVLSILDGQDAYVGSVVLSVVSEDALELSYWILPTFEGRGAASEAARAAIAWARTAIAPGRIVAKTRPGAAASQRVLVKAGLRATGTEEQPTFELSLA